MKHQHVTSRSSANRLHICLHREHIRRTRPHDHILLGLIETLSTLKSIVGDISCLLLWFLKGVEGYWLGYKFLYTRKLSMFNITSPWSQTLWAKNPIIHYRNGTITLGCMNLCNPTILKQALGGWTLHTTYTVM